MIPSNTTVISNATAISNTAVDNRYIQPNSYRPYICGWGGFLGKALGLVGGVSGVGGEGVVLGSYWGVGWREVLVWRHVVWSVSCGCASWVGDMRLQGGVGAVWGGVGLE